MLNKDVTADNSIGAEKKFSFEEIKKGAFGDSLFADLPEKFKLRILRFFSSQGFSHTKIANVWLFLAIGKGLEDRNTKKNEEAFDLGAVEREYEESYNKSFKDTEHTFKELMELEDIELYDLLGDMNSVSEFYRELYFEPLKERVVSYFKAHNTSDEKLKEILDFLVYGGNIPVLDPKAYKHSSLYKEWNFRYDTTLGETGISLQYFEGLDGKELICELYDEGSTLSEYHKDFLTPFKGRFIQLFFANGYSVNRFAKIWLYFDVGGKMPVEE